MAVIVRRLVEGDGLLEAVGAGRAAAEADPADFEVVEAIDAAIALVGQAPLRGRDLETLGKRWPGGPGDEALAIAVAAVLSEPDPNEALLLAVNHGGDSDSTGAIAGNLLGAHYGASALRADWRERVELADVITDMAGRLLAIGPDVTAEGDLVAMGIESAVGASDAGGPDHLQFERIVEALRHSALRENAQVSIDVLDLTLRSRNCLGYAGIETIEQLIALTPDELMALRNFGQTSLDDIVKRLEAHGFELSRSSQPRLPAIYASHSVVVVESVAPERSAERATLLAALEEFAAWGEHFTEATTIGELIDLVGSGLQSIDGSVLADWVRNELLAAPLSEVGAEVGERYDWRKTLADAEAIIRTDPENAVLLDRRITALVKKETTSLAELADELGVTSEAVRRREVRLIERLVGVGADPLVADRTDWLVRLIGGATPVASLEACGFDIEARPDRLLLAITGRHRHPDARAGRPIYRLVQLAGRTWLVDKEIEDLGRLVQNVFEATTSDVVLDGIDLLDAVGVVLGDACKDQAALFAEELVSESGAVRRSGGHFLLWTGNYADKAVRVLQQRGEPMGRDELAEAVNPDSIRGVINAFQGDERVVCVGSELYGLTEWRLEEFGGIVAHMKEVLEERGGGPMELDELSTELERRFAVNPGSVEANATRHFAFVASGSTVRLRRPDEDLGLKPLEETHGIVRIGEGRHRGQWALRIEVGYDPLRGSSPHLPPGFTVHVGLQPEQRVFFETNYGQVTGNWTQMDGSLGSVKGILEGLGAVDDDLLFVIAVGHLQLHFRHVPHRSLPEDDEARLRALLLADPVVGDLRSVLAYAFGFDSDPTGTELEDRVHRRMSRFAGREVTGLLRRWLDGEIGR
jgi:hypothetical protein